MKPVVFKINKQAINKNNSNNINENSVKNNTITIDNSNKPIKLVENIYYFKK